MKTLMYKFGITTLFLVFSALTLNSQSVKATKQVDHTEFTLQKTINLNDESDKMEVTIPISESKVALQLNIASIVWAGELSIEVYDPTGEKLGDYSVGSENSINVEKTKSDPTKNKGVTGQIIKTVDFPIVGKWKIIIIPKNAKGTLEIRTNQVSLKK